MVEIKDRTLYIDMDEIEMPRSYKSYVAMWKGRRKKRAENPFSVSVTKFKSIPELRQRVEAYFESCMGYKYYKGKPVLDANGEQVKGQIEPYTISGLARYLGVNPRTLLNYQSRAKAGLIDPEYGEIIDDAKLRIQEYAEKRLYDRDGSSGARFVLEAGFGWVTEKENKELKQSDARIQVSREKLEFIKKQAEDNKLQDTELTVNILRATDED